MLSRIHLLLILALFILLTPAVNAQFQGSFFPDTINQPEVVIPDTLTLKYFTLKDINKSINVSDTILQDFEKYDPVKGFYQGALNLGNLGSAHQIIQYRLRDHINVEEGFDQYDLYKLNKDDIRFYDTHRAYNDLFFSPVAGQRNFAVKAKFSRSFAKDIKISLDFERFNQEGFYKDQKAKSTAFGFGIWKRNKEKGHNLFFRFVANNHNEEHNGGVTTDTLFDQEFYRIRTAIPVVLSGDTTRHQHFSYTLDNYFEKPSGKYRFHHQIQYESGYFRFGDHDVSNAADSVFYDSFLTDSRGIRYFLGFNKISNTADVSFVSKGIDIQLGLGHKYQRFDESDRILNFNDITAFGNFSFQLKELSQIHLQSAVGLGSNAGQLQLKGKITLTPIEQIEIQGFLELMRYGPSLIHQRAAVTGFNIYDNDFSTINEVQFGGRLNWSKINADIEFRSGIIENAIAYDGAAFPYQLDSNMEYIQFSFSHRLKWKFIGFENSILYQSFDNNAFNLPSIYSTHNLFVESLLFRKNLLARIGVLLYNIQLDNYSAFMPVNGAFYPTTVERDYYPYSELYGNFKIKRFRLFVKIDNFTELIQKEVHYHVLNHPQFDYKIRFGVRWQFYD